MNLKILLAALPLITTALILPGCGGGAKTTTQTQNLKRDYDFRGSITKVDPAIFPPDDSSWVKVDDTTRRKVFFNDRLTLELVETSRSGLTGNVTTTHRSNDVMGYVITGAAMVTVGKNTRQIAGGGAFVVPSNTPYGVIPAADKTTVLYVYTPPRDDLRPTAPKVRRFPANEIKSIVYAWFALFDEKASAGEFLSYLADTGLSMEMADKKKITSWQGFQDWYGLWSSVVSAYSSTVEAVSVSFDTGTGRYRASTTVSSTTKTVKGKTSTERYQVDMTLVDTSWGNMPKILEYKESPAKK
jgi:quercetin dioxygenase-like cupin family protein